MGIEGRDPTWNWAGTGWAPEGTNAAADRLIFSPVSMAIEPAFFFFLFFFFFRFFLAGASASGYSAPSWLGDSSAPSWCSGSAAAASCYC